jgi:hypothetical protein
MTNWNAIAEKFRAQEAERDRKNAVIAKAFDECPHDQTLLRIAQTYAPRDGEPLKHGMTGGREMLETFGARDWYKGAAAWRMLRARQARRWQKVFKGEDFSAKDMARLLDNVAFNRGRAAGTVPLPKMSFISM